jgi:formylglycine-generating enzyme
VQSGNLVVGFTASDQLNGDNSNLGGTIQDLKVSSDPVFNLGDAAQPGDSQEKYLRIRNEGNIAINYQVDFIVTTDSKLAEVILFDIQPLGGTTQTVAGTVIDAGVYISLRDTNPDTGGLLRPSEDVPQEYEIWRVKMTYNPEAGNEYNDASLEFEVDIQLTAWQFNYAESQEGLNWKSVTIRDFRVFGSSNQTYNVPLGLGIDNIVDVEGGFGLAKYQTTFELWEEVYTWALQNGYAINNNYCRGSFGGGCGGTEQPQFQPVVGISWYDAVVWLNALSELNGFEPVYYLPDLTILKSSILTQANEEFDVLIDLTKNGFRLPTIMEWELGAKWLDGSTWNSGLHVSGSLLDYSNIEESLRYAWLAEANMPATQPVGTKLPNQAGLYDMSGNAWDWTNTLDSNNLALAKGGHYNNSILGYGTTGSTLPHPKSLSLVGYVNGFRIAKNI